MTLPGPFRCSILFMATVSILLSSFAVSSASDCPPTSLCYAIDESRSVSAMDFTQMTDALLSITDEFSLLAPNSSFAAVGFETLAETISPLTTDLDAFKTALRDNAQFNGGSSSGRGLRRCRNLLRNAPNPRVILLIADGEDLPGTPQGVNVAPGIKEMGITIATVGVGRGIDSDALMEIASGPELFTPVSTFSTLPRSIFDILQSMCVDPTPSVSPSPSVTPSLSSIPSISVTPETPSPSPSTSPFVMVSPTPSLASSMTPSSSPSETNVPTTPPSPSASPSPTMKEDNMCLKADCARCGSVLECYVNTGDIINDIRACRLIRNSRSGICPDGNRPGSQTACRQSCRFLPRGVRCFPGQSFGTCPLDIPFGRRRRASRGPKCQTKIRRRGSRRARPQAVETFASYNVCLKKRRGSVSCASPICFRGKCSCKV